MIKYLGPDALSRHLIRYNIRGGKICFTSRTEQSHMSRGCKNFAGIRPSLVQPGHTQSYAMWLGRSRGNFCRNSLILKHMAKPPWASVDSRYILCWVWGFQVISTILKTSDTDFEHHFPTALISSLKLLHCLRSVFPINHWMSSSCHKRLQERETLVFKGIITALGNVTVLPGFSWVCCVAPGSIHISIRISAIL